MDNIPFGILKPVYGWLEKLLFEKPFKRAHLHYLNYRSLGNYWSELTDGLEYSWRPANIFSNDKTPVTQIAIRTKKKKTFNYLSLNVRGEAAFAVYEQTVEINKISKMPHVISLHQMPIQDIAYDEESERFFTSYNSVKLTILKLSDGAGKSLENIEVEQFRPTYFEILNGNFVEKWGLIYNLDLFDEAKRRLRIRLLNFKHGFGGGGIYYPSYSGRGDKKNSWHSGLRVKLCDVLLHDRFINPLFWTLYFTKLIDVKSDT